MERFVNPGTLELFFGWNRHTARDTIRVAITDVCLVVAFLCYGSGSTPRCPSTRSCPALDMVYFRA